MLDAVGIDAAVARAYEELVVAGQLTAAEVAERCGVPATSAAASLTALEAHGLVAIADGQPGRYQAIAPELAIGELIARREKELQEARDAMQRLSAEFRQALWNRDAAADVEVVRGAPNIARLLVRFHEQTREQLRGFDRPPYASELGTMYPLEQARMADGITYRMIYDSAALSRPGRMYDDILPSSAAGEQARVRPELPIKLMISDDTLALIPAVVTSQSLDTTFVIHESPVLDALIALFEAEWARATPIPGADGPDGAAPGAEDGTGDAPDPETATLLAMMAVGMTDEAVARSMSWSVRTAQRRIRQLMDDLGVTSRFQAGVAATKRGWI